MAMSGGRGRGFKVGRPVWKRLFNISLRLAVVSPVLYTSSEALFCEPSKLDRLAHQFVEQTYMWI